MKPIQRIRRLRALASDALRHQLRMLQYPGSIAGMKAAARYDEAIAKLDAEFDIAEAELASEKRAANDDRHDAMTER